MATASATAERVKRLALASLRDRIDTTTAATDFSAAAAGRVGHFGVRPERVQNLLDAVLQIRQNLDQLVLLFRADGGITRVDVHQNEQD